MVIPIRYRRIKVVQTVRPDDLEHNLQWKVLFDDPSLSVRLDRKPTFVIMTHEAPRIEIENSFTADPLDRIQRRQKSIKANLIIVYQFG